MKSCPHCAEIPGWHFMRNVSRTRRVDCFLFTTGCAHTADFSKSLGIVESADRAAVEQRWDAHAESLFTTYTARWTDIQRTSFRARLWPMPPPVIPTELQLT